MVWPTEFDTKMSEFDAMELPGQQLAAAQASSKLDHLINLDFKSPPGCQRLTGIIVTMGKATHDQEVMEKLIGAGMNIALINMSYGSLDENIETVKMLRQAAKNYSTNVGKCYPLGIAARLSGRNIRTGNIAETYGTSVELKTGETVRLTSDETYRDRCSQYTVFVDFLNLADQVTKGDRVLIDNQTISLRIEIISASTITCKVEIGGTLGSYKDVFVPNVIFDITNFTEKDKIDIDALVAQQIDFIVAPFVHDVDSITELREILGDKGKRISIIATIQSVHGYKNFNAICEMAQGVIISRQELGSDITPKKLVIVQKNMIGRANLMNVPVCVAAQLLNSMREKKYPLRTELLDISNCILDGADCLLLSSETAIGLYPVETVACLSSACKEAEACIWTRQVYTDMLDKTPTPSDQATCTALAAVIAAQRCIAAGIIVITTTGKTAAIVSKYKPRCPIIALTRYLSVAKQMNLWRGIIGLLYEDQPDMIWHSDVENRVSFATKWALERGFVRVGDPLIVVSGWRPGAGFTNTMRVIYAAPDNPIS